MIINEPLETGLWSFELDHKHAFEFCVISFLCINHYKSGDCSELKIMSENLMHLEFVLVKLASPCR
jgi:hypothetical protein